MAGRGRRRRNSNSTINPPAPNHYPVEMVLLDPDDGIENYPTFTLKNATIYSAASKRLANPLLTVYEGPFVARGQLEVEKDLFGSLTRMSYRDAHVEIRETRFTIGWSDQDGNDFGSLWVLGTKGFFEIEPSPEYQATYNQCHEAIALFYKLQDIYLENQTKRKSKLSLEELFFKYAVQVGDGSTRADVERRCDKWARFLLSHCPVDQEFNWERTDFWNWLVQRHPDTVKMLKEIREGKRRRVSPSRTAWTESRQSSISQGRRATASRRSRSSDAMDMIVVKTPTVETPAPPVSEIKVKPLSAVVPTVVHTDLAASPGSAACGSPVDNILAVLEEFADVNGTDNSWNKMTAQIFLNCKISQYKAAAEVTAFHSKGLLSRLSARWKGTPFHRWLALQAAKPKHKLSLATEMDLQTVPKFKKAIPTPRTSTPRGSVTPMPTRAERGNDQRLATAGKSPRLRYVPDRKRDADQMDPTSVTRSGRERLKRTRLASWQDQDIEMGDASVESDEADSAINAEFSANLDEDYQPPVPLPAGACRIILYTEKMPCTSPTGPNGTWVCEENGCGYIVRAADEPEGQELVRQHSDDHGAQSSRVDLARQESSRLGHGSINHLLEKLQSEGRKALDAEKKQRHKKYGSDMDALVPRIKQRLLV